MSAKDFVVSKNAADLRKVRLSGATKSLDQMTISELSQLRPGGASAAAGYTITAETSTVTVNGSSVLFNLMNERGLKAVQVEAAQIAPTAKVRIGR